jgi:tRNA wybutosine-synthesizing protein 3
MDRSFDNARAGALRRLAEARDLGRADARAAPAVDALNASPDWVTTSSCSGRVQLLALAAPGAKSSAVVLGRWHDAAPDAATLAQALARRPPERVAHLLVEPPILHLLARDLAAATTLLRLGAASGWKACHLRSVGPRGRVAVELGHTGRISTPLAWPKGSADPGFLGLLAAEGPPLLARGHAALDRLAGRAIPAARAAPAVDGGPTGRVPALGGVQPAEEKG